MKNKVHHWKCTFFLMIFILLFSCLVLSQGEGGAAAELTPEQFDKLPNPTAYDLAKVQNPTLENFNKLMPEQQGSYLLQNYNNEFAVTFYKAIDNVGKNPDLDKKYFSGKEISGGSRTTISQSKEAAGKYFKDQFKNSYNFESLGDDFVFDPEKKTLANFGKIISLEDYQDKPEVKSITAVAEGFVIELEKAVAEGAEGVAPASQKVSIGGTGAGTVSYKDKGITFTDSAGKKNSFQDFGESTSIKATSDGYSVDGRATGSVMLGDKLIQFNNRRGVLSLGAEGAFTSENAEIYSDKFYFDGAGEKKGKEVVVWSHGDTQLRNLRGTNSVFIDRNTGVGVVSQGQSGIVDKKGNKEAIFIHLGEATVPEAGAAAPEQSAEELRKQALALQPANGDLGKSGDVRIKKNPQGETIVIAKGQVEVGFYGKDPKSRGLVAGMPFFKGTNGKSEYELKTNGETEVKVRGQAVYMDRYYGTTVLKEGNVEVGEGNGGIHTLQDGASLSIARKTGSDTDLVTSTCFECTAGKVMTIGKNIFAGDAVGKDGEAVFLTETVPFNIEVVVDEKGGFSYNTNLADAGRIAEMQQSGKAVALGKFLNMRMIDSKNPENGIEQDLLLAKPSEKGAPVAYMETSQNGKVIEGSRRQLDFGIKDALGDAVILTSEKNSQSMMEMTRLLEEGKISELSKLKFEDDPQLRKFILAQNGIDIEYINNPEYLQKVEAATKSQDEFDNWKVKIENKYGIQLDDNGACIAPPGCELKIQKAIQKADKLGYWYTQAKVKALDAQGNMLDAIIASEADGGEASGAKAAKSALLEEKKQIVQARKYLLGVAEQKKKEEERKQEETAQEYQNLVNEYDSVEKEYEQKLAAEKAASQESLEEWARIEEEAREGEKVYLQQKAEAEREAERVRAVSEGVPLSYESQVSLADESAIEELRREKVKLEVQRDTIEFNFQKSLEQAQTEREAEVEKLAVKKTHLALSQYTSGDMSDDIYQQIRVHARAEAEAEVKEQVWLKWSRENHEKQINGLNNAIQRIDSETEALVSDYIPDRPDYAAELALRTGNTELARDIAEIEVTPISPARANQLVAESYVADEEYGTAAEYAQMVIDDPEASAASRQSAEAIQKESDRLAYSTARRNLEGRRFAVDVDIANQRTRDKEEAEGSLWNFFTEYSPKYLFGYGAKVITLPTSGLKWSDPTYLETKEIQKERGINAMRQESESLHQAINLLNQKEANGVDPETGLHELTQKFATDSTVANTIQYVEATSLGKEVDPEIAAAVELEQILGRIGLNGGDVYQARAELEALHEKYLGTKAADTARNKIKELDQMYGLLTVGALEEWRDTAATIVGDPTALLPLGAIAKYGAKGAIYVAKAAKATKIVQAAAKGAKAATTAVKATKAAEAAAKVAAPVMRGASKVGTTAVKAGKVVLWGKSAKAVKVAEREVALAEKSLNVAKEIGGSPLSIAEQKVAQAVKNLENAKAVVQAEQVAKAGTVAGIKYNLDIGLTKSERAAISKLDTATEAFRTAQKTGSAQLGEKAADVMAAAKKVEDARLSNIISKKVSSAVSTRFGAKAADDVAKQVNALEEMGAVLKPESSSGKVVVDTSGVSPALKSQVEVKAAEFWQAMKSADVDEAKIAQEALEEVKAVPISSESSAGKAVMGELAAQEKAAKEMSAVIPITPKPSAAVSVKKAVPVKAAEPIDFLAYKADQIEAEAVRNTVGKIAATENAKKVAVANDALPVVNKNLASQRALKSSIGDKSPMQVLEDAVGEQSLAAKFDNGVTGGVKVKSSAAPETLSGSENFIAEESLINDEIVSLEFSSKTELPKLTVVPKTEVEERIVSSTTLKMLADASPSGPLSKSALKDGQLQQKVLAGVAEKAKFGSSTEAGNILKRYNKLSEQAERGEDVILPKYYHATEKEGLEGILASRTLESRSEKMVKGAFVSSVPEVKGYGDYVVVFGSDLETRSGLVSKFSDRVWIKIDESIPVTPENIAYVIVKDEDMVKPTLKMLKKNGFKDTPVITLKEAEMERELILQSRVASSDRANVILEGGLRLKSNPKNSLYARWDPDQSAIDNTNSILNSLQEGDVLELQWKGGGYGYITKNKQDEVFFNTVNPTTRGPIQIQLVAMQNEGFEIAKAKGLDYNAVDSIMSLVDPSEKNVFTGIRVDPAKVENRLFEALANGEFSQVSYSLDEVPDVAKFGEEAIAQSVVQSKGQLIGSTTSLRAIRGDEIQSLESILDTVRTQTGEQMEVSLGLAGTGAQRGIHPYAVDVDMLERVHLVGDEATSYRSLSGDIQRQVAQTKEGELTFLEFKAGKNPLDPKKGLKWTAEEIQRGEKLVEGHGVVRLEDALADGGVVKIDWSRRTADGYVETTKTVFISLDDPATGSVRRINFGKFDENGVPLESIYQEVYGEGERTFALHKQLDASPEAREGYIDLMDKEIQKYTSPEHENYLKVSKRLYNQLSVREETAMAERLLPLFKGESAQLGRMSGELEHIEIILGKRAPVEMEVLAQQVDDVALGLRKLNPELGEEVSEGLKSLSEAIRTGDISTARETLVPIQKKIASVASEKAKEFLIGDPVLYRQIQSANAAIPPLPSQSSYYQVLVKAEDVGELVETQQKVVTDYPFLTPTLPSEFHQTAYYLGKVEDFTPVEGVTLTSEDMGTIVSKIKKGLPETQTFFQVESLDVARDYVVVRVKGTSENQAIREVLREHLLEQGHSTESIEHFLDTNFRFSESDFLPHISLGQVKPGVFKEGASLQKLYTKFRETGGLELASVQGELATGDPVEMQMQLTKLFENMEQTNQAGLFSRAIRKEKLELVVKDRPVGLKASYSIPLPIPEVADEALNAAEII